MIIPAQSASQGQSSIYRLKRGTKLSDIPPLPPNPPVPDLSSLNGPFQLAEFLSLKVRHDPHDISNLVEVPTGDQSMGGKAPDRNVWIYEHLRRIPIDLTPLLTALLPICTRETCPDMKAHEWLYLCSAHGGGAESCSAIDYILHTLDSTTALLNSSQNFPSRMQIPPSSVSHFPSLFRRLSRIFSHAYFHHREVFQLSEGETSLYARFVGLCEKYELVGSSLLPIPRDVIGSNLNHQEESSEEEEEDHDEIDEEEDEDEEEDGRGRKDDSSQQKEKRTQSLDRSLPPSTSPSKSTKLERPTSIPERETITASPVKPPPPQRNDTLKPDTIGDLRDQPISPIKFGVGKGKGTLSRGKQPRATMHWGGEDIPGLPTQSSALDTTSKSQESLGEDQNKSPIGKFRDRSESIESAIHIPEGLGIEPPDELKEENLENIPTPEPTSEEPSIEQTDDLNGGIAENQEEIVPKDEIELLEEKGELKPETTVAPLSPPSSIISNTESKSDSDLDSNSLSNQEPQAKENPSTSSESAVEVENKLEGDEDNLEEIDLSNNENTKDKSITNLTKLESDSSTSNSISISSPNLKSKKKFDKSLINNNTNSNNNSPIPSPIRGKGKLVPAEISSPSSSSSSKSNFNENLEDKKDELKKEISEK
ncbi:uncharacterized protein I206_101853 [Kwoniella pini CBS 10737]|uniref:Mob1 family protein n=1 Tax=Kwoniella pini CBS 10737 TaxID=1296096 RepID=A0A1B9HVJ7_9TREE|nr:uncharacterized protein I206_07056 [Kwoniella pini CBS 10737]OCF47278.1 hypothetical protein I206_07056 [Kwoniella pini CBS 10737]